MLKFLTCWAFCLAIATVGASANDSDAELSAGGLVLTKNEAIELRTEDLYVSPKQVRVDYLFHNKTAAPVQIIVAFPMPDVTYEGIDDMVAIPRPEASENFLGFVTIANGREVAARVEQKVFVKGVERTGDLQRLGVPFAPYLKDMGQRLDGLPTESRKELLALGLAVEQTEYDTAGKAIIHLEPTWTLKETYYWEQTFPPGDTTIEHRYAPSVGRSAGSTISSAFIPELMRKGEPDPELDDFNEHVRKYCLDSDFIQSARRIKQGLPENRDVMEQRISYVLKTAANWSGPIESFRLVVDKQFPDNIVSFCGQDVRKTGPTTFEMTKSNFTPTEDLSILVLTAHVED